MITKQKEEADEALMEALPAVEAASRALENLDKNDLTELKVSIHESATRCEEFVLVTCLPSTYW